MPALSLIVPVYNVESYVGQCLASILGQDFDDIEVIVVDDASTDDSAAVVAAAIEGSAAARLVRLEHNVGLGFARNVGLDLATGTYLLFVDSDDWLEAGTLRAVYERMEATHADVLVFDFGKADGTGQVVRNRKHHLLAADVPAVFDLHDHPELLELLMVVWNKAYRREFIERLGLRFPKGYYEDLPWTYPVLLAAERITVLDKVCYFYRQRPSGNILRTTGRRHFDLFDQYARVFAFIDAHPEFSKWRPLLLKRMIQHLLFVVNQAARVPAGDRRRYFEETSRLARAVEAEATWPRLRVEERLLRDGDYRRWQLFRAVLPILTPVVRLRTRIRSRRKSPAP